MDTDRIPVPDGYDPQTAFQMNVKIEGYWNKRNDEGKKIYVKGKTIKWVVDSDKFFLCELISDLKEEISWGTCQTPKAWYFDKTESRDVGLVFETQIPNMFRMYESERKITLLVVICDVDGSSNWIGNKPSMSIPSQPSTPIELSSQPLENVRDDVEFSAEMEDAEMEEQLEDETDGFEPQEENALTISHDPENSIIELNSVFPDVKTFRKALKNFAIKHEFDVETLKSDKKRFIGKCKHPACKWRIRASRLRDDKTFMVKKLPHEHTCPTTSMIKGKMVSKSWVADKATSWLQKNSTIGAKEVQMRLQDEYHIKFSYDKAWSGRKAALDNIHGSWEKSFELVYNFKAELEKRCPGSIVEIECVQVGKLMRFSKMFVALKPCIDGFLHGCRPYLAIDSTTLNGKWKGQLAAATGVDGENSIFPVAYAVFDKETNPNWKWFVTQLRKAIGNPSGSEHRECMRHLMENFSKRFHGKIYDENMWPASYAYTKKDCEEHLNKIKAISPEALNWVEKNHKQLWCRSKFSLHSKCDYVTNNISESFNSWIRDLKELHVIELFNQIRRKIMITLDKRRMEGENMEGKIISSVLKELNAKSKDMGLPTVDRASDFCAEVSGKDWSFAVELDKQECTCGEWQLCGQPCTHALAFICTIRGAKIEDYVHEYYSVERFRKAYESVLKPISKRSHWVKADPGFIVSPPKTTRPVGRPRKRRIPGCLEPGKKKTPNCLELGKRRHRCKRCKEYGHQERTCKEPIDEDGQAGASNPPTEPTNKTRKRAKKQVSVQDKDARLVQGEE